MIGEDRNFELSCYFESYLKELKHGYENYKTSHIVNKIYISKYNSYDTTKHQTLRIIENNIDFLSIGIILFYEITTAKRTVVPIRMNEKNNDGLTTT